MTGEYVYAPQCLQDAVDERYLLWTWIKEGRTAEAERAAGWSGLLSLPKECRLDAEGDSIIKPAAELTALRREGRNIEGKRLPLLPKIHWRAFRAIASRSRQSSRLINPRCVS